MNMKTLLLIIASTLALQAQAAITVRDDDGNTVTVQKPAQRILSLAPHITELLFAAGAGDKIVGVTSYSDFPEAAKKIPQIGDNRQLDIERIIALKPDLIVVWMHGSAERQIEMLRTLHIPMYHSEPRKLADIGDSIVRLGQLAGTEKTAQPAAAALQAKLAALKTQYAGRPTLSVFYQVWDKPLYTLSGAHIISEAIRLCGGRNIFDSMKIVAPVVTPEGVLQEDPEVLIGTSEKSAKEKDGGLAMWRQYTSMKAVRANNLYNLDGNLTNRAGPRMIDGAAALCETLETARTHRKN